MKFKVDENLPADLADLLRSAGHDAITVANQNLSGTDDAAISEVCRQEGRAFVTLDLDFADIQTYPPEKYPGLVVLRLARQDKHLVMNVLSRTVPLFKTETLSGRLWIVEERRIRIHGES